MAEKLMTIVIWINVLADLIASYLADHYGSNGIVYNILTPLEKLLTLGIYYIYAPNRIFKKAIIGVSILILLISLIAFYFSSSSRVFHIQPFLWTGLILAILSYMLIRKYLTSKKDFNLLAVWFAFANLLYYSMVVSSLGAQSIAVSFSLELARLLGYGNDIAYSLWSLILLISVLWIKKLKA